MRWQGGRESENVEDQRGGGGGRFPLAAGGGIGTILIVVVALFLGADPRDVFRLVMQRQAARPVPQGGPLEAPSPEQEQAKKFVATILASTEDVWTDLFRKEGREYRNPKLVLFSGRVNSACGLATAAVGPFYCPEDEKVYIDLAFYDELRDRFKAPGDFAQAYVIAHEIGHHVQKQLGISDRVHQMRERLGDAEYNKLSVKLELQADFFAGVWAHHAEEMRPMLEQGDIEEALTAAAAIGDDRLQKQARGYVVPDSFTHGTSAQRVKWFRLGLQTGDLSKGDTFNARDL